MGERFKTGRGVPCDLQRARALYAAAAADSGGLMHVWPPPVGKVPGQLVFVDQGKRERMKQLDEDRQRSDCDVDKQKDNRR